MDGTVCVWDMRSSKPTARLTDHGMAVNSIAWCPAGKLLAAGGDDGTVRLWDTADWRSVAVFGGHVGAVLAVAFFGDGSRIASGGNDGTIRLHSAEADANQVVHFLQTGPVDRLVIEGDSVVALTRLGGPEILRAVVAHRSELAH
jgi:WD40 repeat protein